MSDTVKEKRAQLIRDGFCVFENVLESEMVAKLNKMSEWTIGQEDAAHFENHRAQGCIIPYWKYPHPAFTQVITHPRALAALAELGFEQPKVWSGFVISKPPQSPPLYWHQDGVLWDHPISYTNQPQQYFLMYYLIDTDRDNGCLRLIPGSHLKRYAPHALERQAHADDNVRRAADMNHPAFAQVEGEVDVPVRAGDVVIGDARLLHAAHANQSDQWRTVITIWYWPAYDDLPADVQALVAAHITDNPSWSKWVEVNRHVAEPLIPIYEGATEPVSWNNSPGERLRTSNAQT
ncbi:MAG: phytanoyl-CoA dioxygenase family protein [Chloroflexota bacterium]